LLQVKQGAIGVRQRAVERKRSEFDLSVDPAGDRDARNGAIGGAKIDADGNGWRLGRRPQGF
jgi:hypothetical protein